ncbi:UNVERIFIED_CONTAM: hypothetical protein HDU68_006606 [Siphonaria sp. JEL0065]|nr:hypothetical protein HDU68_006606 [Siphonaria sp. JEL0065]
MELQQLTDAGVESVLKSLNLTLGGKKPATGNRILRDLSKVAYQKHINGKKDLRDRRSAHAEDA